MSNIWDAYWVERYHFFESAGYRLREHFHPDHVPPSNTVPYLKDPSILRHARVSLMDARRISNNILLMLKWTDTAKHPTEVEIGQLFSAEPPRDDPLTSPGSL
ncbi:unnamed protein product [Mycena citricolor]|uniref:Uncharacterized protein n=1 Tax=Mycena citricolor TaxID=2018698 RepID=A0AAD2GX49_9AGAR|nr:unnamed protein product [Mycena citricolor]